jgi:hypothetical protein
MGHCIAHAFIFDFIVFYSIPVCFFWLQSLLHFSNGAGVGPTFEVCVSAKVMLSIVGNERVWFSDGLSGMMFM